MNLFHLLVVVVFIGFLGWAVSWAIDQWRLPPWARTAAFILVALFAIYLLLNVLGLTQYATIPIS